ncbi:MAG: hypothetical protein ACTHPS_23305 [Streptosporangiaceae bacterium]
MAVFGDRILRCTDGHLFVSSETSRLFGSVHLGPVRRMQCPVDGKIVNVANVRQDTLTPEQVEEARRFHT